ncbi:ABC transporter permease [Enterovirga rhinocerotis]|uniref:Spermidine/putrescine transport system permease protein n=1 Tax=Enterovirga rhinocerotis TaxID=1339210 RepID=A0A4R7C7V6_9HYPH|nr:ABC transporter permease [Enterovirga rhinocerotis]TDR92916.1 spermidine/putrescine transport system permease protein [Enterovirga rhinocerotis]
MTTVGQPRDLRRLLVIPGAAWLVFFCVLPFCFMLVMSFWTSNMYGTKAIWTLDNYRKIFTDPIYSKVLLSTLQTSAVTTVLSLFLAYPVAWFLARQKGYRKSVFLLMIFLPFWSSYVIRTFVWLPILGRTGLINQTLLTIGIIDQPIDWLIYNTGATYVGLVYVYMLYMLLPIYLSLDKLDMRLVDAASDLGAGPFQIFRRIVLPLSAPGILSGCVMVFLLDCGAFVTPQILGGPSALMYGNLIAAQFMDGSNWALGAALSVVLIVIIMTLMFLVSRKVGLRSIVAPAAH